MDDIADGMNSLESIKRSDVYTSKQLISEDSNLRVPFPLLSGEQVEYLGSTTDGIIALSTFRLFVTNKHGFVNVPIGLIDNVEKEMFVIYVYCKTGPYFRYVYIKFLL
jgi:myotubularin-related protein 3/4